MLRAARPAWFVAGSWLFLVGCTNWSYTHLQIGMTRQQAERLLPADAFQRSDLGYSCSSQDGTGHGETLVVLLAPDGLVAGKLQATRRTPESWLHQQGGFRLRGEIDPARLGLAATGPLDTLRAVVHDLLTCPGATPARTAHAWVAAGLLRLIERWPHVGESAPTDPELADALERVSAGGAAQIKVDRRGVYSFEYIHGTVR